MTTTKANEIKAVSEGVRIETIPIAAKKAIVIRVDNRILR
jgi:hypothetical protein